MTRAPLVVQRLGHVARPTADVENGHLRLHQVKRQLVRTGIAQLERVMLVGLLVIETAIIQQAHRRDARPQRGEQDECAVAPAVDVRDLVAVERRHGNLGNALLRAQHLDNDVGVEVEIVGIEGKRHPLECFGAVGAVAGMKFRQVAAKQLVLDKRQHLVADPLVQRHPTFECFAPVDHA